MAGGSDKSSDVASKLRRSTPPAAPAKSTPEAAGRDAKAAAAKQEGRGQTRVRSRMLADGGIASNAAHKGGAFLGTTVNLSIGGCLIRTYEALESGMDVTLRLNLPEGELNTAGKVVHVNEDAVGCRMVGVRFVPLKPDQHTLLVQHISTFDVESRSQSNASAANKSGVAGSATGKYVIEGRINSN